MKRNNPPVSELTLRDYYAGATLAGLITKLPLVDQLGIHGEPVADKVAHNLDIARSCFAIADAMLSIRDEE